MASILTGMVVAGIRVFQPAQAMTRSWVAAALCFFSGHVFYLTAWRFDYTYNIAACVGVGLGTYVIWAWWFWTVGRRRPYSWRIVAVILSMCAAMSLEVLDFAPWWLLGMCASCCDAASRFY
jgi:post-GPI attachment to proteins factor 3